MTDLPNRRAFQDRLKAAIDVSTSSATAAGLLFIDLDRFKEVNDTLGHEVGDGLPQRVSARLRSLLRSDDFVARVGGDEFAFLLFADKDRIYDKSTRVARRIMNRLQISVPSPGGPIRVGCTVGIATCPADATDTEGLMALADRLMLDGKRCGRNRVVAANAVADKARAPHPAPRRWRGQPARPPS